MSFIKIDRKIIDSEVWANSKYLKIWIWMLVKANYKQKYVSVNTGRGETSVLVKRGQFIFGRFKAEQELDFDGSLIYRTVKRFEEMGMIDIVSNSHYSLVSICKYDEYQTEKDNDEQAMNKQRTSNEQAMNTTKKDKKEEEIPLWKTDFEIYKEECKQAFKLLAADTDLIQKLQLIYTGYNIQKSIYNCYASYWSTKDGWMNKKGKKSKAIDWKATVMKTVKNNLVK